MSWVQNLTFLNDPARFYMFLIVFGMMAVLVFILLFYVSAPYGRHSRKGWGPLIESRWGWLIMELPASVLFFVFFWGSSRRTDIVPLILLLVWQSHYFHRAFLYPFSLRTSRKMPALVMGFAFVFNIINATIQAGWIFVLAPASLYSKEWLTDPRFLLGLGLFYSGYTVTKSADRTLRGLRRPGESAYEVPGGGLFKWISCPNYFGEIIEWAGWGLALWSFSGGVFFLWTAANLIPRARAHHIWYKNTFPDYPPERRAVIPFLF